MALLPASIDAGKALCRSPHPPEPSRTSGFVSFKCEGSAGGGGVARSMVGVHASLLPSFSVLFKCRRLSDSWHPAGHTSVPSSQSKCALGVRPHKSSQLTAVLETATSAAHTETEEGVRRGNVSPAEPQPKLAIRKLSRMVGPTRKPILDDVSFEVFPRQLFGLVGPSGSGKSTLLRAINRLWEPPPGSVWIDGEDVSSLRVQDVRVRVGMVFQSPNLFEGTVEFNVRYGPSLRGKRLSDEDVETLLLRAGMLPSKQLLSRSVAELSGGEAQRVSIARALANSPQILLLDEPTSSLDPTATRKVEETVARLQHAEGLTVVLVTHSMSQVERLADVAGLLQDGRLVATGAPLELKESENPTVAQFFAGELE